MYLVVYYDNELFSTYRCENDAEAYGVYSVVKKVADEKGVKVLFKGTLTDEQFKVFRKGMRVFDENEKELKNKPSNEEVVKWLKWIIGN